MREVIVPCGKAEVPSGAISFGSIKLAALMLEASPTFCATFDKVTLPIEPRDPAKKALRVQRLPELYPECIKQVELQIPETGVRNMLSLPLTST